MPIMLLVLVVQVTVVIGWTLCIGCLAALVYGLYNTQLDRLSAAIYSSLSHTVWALALSWIIIACSTGYGGQSCRCTMQHIQLSEYVEHQQQWSLLF